MSCLPSDRTVPIKGSGATLGESAEYRAEAVMSRASATRWAVVPGLLIVLSLNGAPAYGGPAPTPSPSPGPNADAPGAFTIPDHWALWFIGAIAVAVSLLWALPLFYDTRQATRWRRQEQTRLIDLMITKVTKPTVEDIRQIASAISTQPRGTRGLTQSLLSLIIATFIGIALIATLVSAGAGSDEMRKTIVTALLSILASIAGFYFGARTSENATEQATRPPEPRGVDPGPAAGPARMEVTTIDPVTGPAAGGTPVTITGTGLHGTTGVNFGTVPSPLVRVSSDQQVTAVSPAGQGTVDVVVVADSQTSEANATTRFTYT
ncbi:IPT/TIG domain-containing protein [Actinoplanes sp. NPDC023936]|uniref:IPT/TIG domain-containing protein n=1 Tax=Actinoplanes sp. NPDC023936 TaxID=3154910 RepID=UPI00340F32C6